MIKISKKKKKENETKTKFIAGTFLVQANEAFLNGGGSSVGEDQNVIMPKFMWVNGRKVPYVSSQSWKHWLRETLIDETEWPASNLRAVGWNAKGNTSKVAGMLNPIDYPEDDIFGYMFAYKDIPKELTEEQKEIVETLPKEQLVRPAVFLASLLSAIQTKSTISKDEAFIHLEGENSPLPYTTGFYNADLNAIFGIDVSRLGIYDNLTGNELNSGLVEDAIENEKISIIKKKRKKALYQKSDLEGYQKNCIESLLDALARLRGGAKLAQFGVDVSPKAILCVGLDCRSLILSNLFSMGNEKPVLDIDLLKELISDYKDRFTTNIYIGIRKNYLENEEEILKLKEENLGANITITTPIQISEKIGNEL